jgi:hypothetical protein
MDKLHVEAEQTAQAAPAIVWALVSDATTYPRWGPWSEVGYRVRETPRRAARARCTGCGPRAVTGCAARSRRGRPAVIDDPAAQPPLRHRLYQVPRSCNDVDAASTSLQRRESGNHAVSAEADWATGADHRSREHPGNAGVSGGWPAMRLFVPVNRVRGEGGHADRDVLGAVRSRGAVPHPFPRARMNRLTGLYGHLAAFRLDDQGSAQYDGEFVELRTLPGLGPAGGTAHMRDAHAALPSVSPSDVLIDQLGRLAGRGHPARLSDQLRHDR